MSPGFPVLVEHCGAEHWVLFLLDGSCSYDVDLL